MIQKSDSINFRFYLYVYQKQRDSVYYNYLSSLILLEKINDIFTKRLNLTIYLNLHMK